MNISLKNWLVKSLLAIVVAGVPVAALQVSGNQTELNNSYRYPFSLSASENVTRSLEQEIAFYQERINQKPDDGLELAALARVYLKMARATRDNHWYLQAEKSAQQSLVNLPFDNFGATLVLARVAEARHEFTETIRLAEKVLQSQATNEDALAMLVTANLAMGKVKEAESAAHALVEQLPSLGSFTLRALVEIAQGQEEAAIKDFQLALAAEEPGEKGSSAWTRTLMGRFYAQGGEADLARELFQEALQIIPRYPLAIVNLAELETKLKNYQVAEELYAQVLGNQDHPHVFDHLAWYGLAQVKKLQGQDSEAEEIWERAEESFRNDHHSDDFGHRRELARLLLARGHTEDLEEALALMQEEVQVRRDAETLDTLAWALSRLERWSEAKQVLQEVLDKGIRDPEIFSRAGSIEEALGNDTQARIYFRLAEGRNFSETVPLLSP